MRRLVRVELTRLRWRRAAVLLVLAAVVVASVVFAVTAWNTRPATEADRQRVERLVERETQQPYTQRELRKCLKHPERYGVDGTDVQAGCEDMTLPQPDWFGTRPTLEPRRRAQRRLRPGGRRRSSRCCCSCSGRRSRATTGTAGR